MTEQAQSNALQLRNPEVLKEWLWCLLSRRHAKKTWLRITQEEENRASIILRLIVIGLVVLLGLVLWLDISRYNHFHHQLKLQPGMTQITITQEQYQALVEELNNVQ